MTVFSSRWQAGGLAASLVIIGLFAGCDDSDGNSPDAAVNPDGAATGGTGGTPGTGGVPAQGGKDAGVDAATDATTDGGGDAAPVVMAEADVDMVFVRFNENGQLDTQFGSQGVAQLNLSGRAGNVYDKVSGISLDGQGRLVVFGAIKGKDRLDTDRVVLRLTSAGVLDPNFAAATQNVFSLNLANANDIAKKGLVQADGKIVSSGYSSLATSAGTQTANSIVLLRLNGDGTPDSSFGFSGVSVNNPFRSNSPNVPWGMAEAYSVALQGDNYVATGYGRLSPSTTAPLDIISARFTSAGLLDPTFKDAAGAYPVSVIDLSAGLYSDRGRDLAILPDGRVVVAGSKATSATAVDGLLVVLTKDGALDTTFNGVGYKSWDLGRLDDAFHSLATSADGKTAFVAGFSKGNDKSVDAIVGIVPLEGATLPIVKNDPISESGNDGFNAIAVGPGGKFYAAGYVADSAQDTALVVVRYNSDGTRDTTFGTAGVARKNVAVGKGVLEAATSIVVQADGKVVLGGQAEGN